MVLGVPNEKFVVLRCSKWEINGFRCICQMCFYSVKSNGFNFATITEIILEF